VCSVAPGLIYTQRVEAYVEATSKRTGRSREEILEDAVLRAAEALRTTGGVRRRGGVLASERASYVSGSLIRVDGGMVSAL